MLDEGEEGVPAESDERDVDYTELWWQEEEVDELGRGPYTPVSLPTDNCMPKYCST